MWISFVLGAEYLLCSSESSGRKRNLPDIRVKFRNKKLNAQGHAQLNHKGLQKPRPVRSSSVLSLPVTRSLLGK